MKILLVDDEQAVLDVFGDVLKNQGFTIVLGRNGKEALEKAEQELPDAILLDQILPDMYGNQILTLLKKNEKTKAIPVAILSNYSSSTQDEFVKDAISLGASDYIFKYQIEPEDIINKVNQLLQEAKTKQQESVINRSV